MPISVMDATSVLRTLSRLSVWDGTALVRIGRAKVMDSDGVTLRTVATFTTPLSATYSPLGVFAVGASNTPLSLTTNAVTVTPSGGTGPYTYAWTVHAYSAATSPTIGNAALATTAFTQSAVDPDTTETATFRCTVTDAFAQTAQVDVPATFEVTSLS